MIPYQQLNSRFSSPPIAQRPCLKSSVRSGLWDDTWLRGWRCSVFFLYSYFLFQTSDCGVGFVMVKKEEMERQIMA